MPSAILTLNGTRDSASIRVLQLIHEHRDELTMGDGFPLTQPIKILAADGGANLLHLAEIPADAIIGDCDSLSQEAQDWHMSQGAFLKKEPDQDRNDLEKALDWMNQESMGSAVIAGFEGDRLDMLNGLLALLIHRHRPRLLLAGRTQLVERVDPGFHELNIGPGKRFSLTAPLGSAEVDIQGAEWELERVTLLPGCGGVSNVSREEMVHLATSKTLLLFREAPWALPSGNEHS